MHIDHIAPNIASDLTCMMLSENEYLLKVGLMAGESYEKLLLGADVSNFKTGLHFNQPSHCTYFFLQFQQRPIKRNGVVCSS